MFRIVESDKQIRANADELPEEVHLEDVRCNDKAEHRHREERQESVETLESLFVALSLIVLIALSHITERVDVNHERHRSNDDKHHYADWCQTESYIKGKELSEPEPCEVEHCHRRVHTLTTVETTVDDMECLLHCLILSCIEEVVVSRVQAKAEEHRQNASADDTGNLLRHLHT